MNIVDLRDLADELDELNEEIDSTIAVGGMFPTDSIARRDALVALGLELGESIRTIGEDYEPTMIAEADFVEYAQELAEDCGMIDPNATWPANCIDWVQAARELKYDYTSVSFDGTDYLIRSW